MADFIADWTPTTHSHEQPKIETIWQLECDGAYQRDGAETLAVLTAPSGTQLKYTVRLDFKGCTNKVAEYEGLLLGLRKARVLGARRLSIRSDSELITGHINKSNRALKSELAKYLAAVRSMKKCFLGFSICSFPRSQNQLANVAVQNVPLPPDVFFETLM